MSAIMRILATLCLLLFVAAAPDRALSQTYQADINGTTYEFFLTSGDGTLEVLTQQFWWGDQALAASAARTVALELGTETYVDVDGECLTVDGCGLRFAFSRNDVDGLGDLVSYVYYDKDFTPEEYEYRSTNALLELSTNVNTYVVARVVGVPEISSSGAAASLAAIFALMLLLREAMMRPKVVSNNA